MSQIKVQLSQMIKDSMKSKDKPRLAAARALHAAIRKKEVDERIDLEDDQVIRVIQTLSKQRKESIVQFEKGGRDDLVQTEKFELDFLEAFLPEQLSDEEIEKVVKAAIAQVGASSPKDMGKVMQAVLPRVEGRADGKRVSQLVKSNLT